MAYTGGFVRDMFSLQIGGPGRGGEAARGRPHRG